MITVVTPKDVPTSLRHMDFKTSIELTKEVRGSPCHSLVGCTGKWLAREGSDKSHQLLVWSLGRQRDHLLKHRRKRRAEVECGVSPGLQTLIGERGVELRLG